jgi:hypothetical protein
MKNEKRMSDRETMATIFALYGSVFLLFMFWLQRAEHRGGGFVLETTLDTRIVMSLVAFIFGFMSVYKIVKYRS